MSNRPGKEQFRRAITQFRNLHIIAALRPLMTMRTEVIGNDEFLDRGGADSPTRTHLIAHLQNCDKIRRHVTHNPSGKALDVLLAEAKDADEAAEVGDKPFSGDNIQNMSGGLVDLPWALDGSDPNIPLQSQLEPEFAQSNGIIILGAIDRAITNWTRLNSNNRTRYITEQDSLRMYGSYQEILGFVQEYLGDENRVDVAQVLPTSEPLGPSDSPNIRGESTSPQPAGQ